MAAAMSFRSLSGAGTESLADGCKGFDCDLTHYSFSAESHWQSEFNGGPEG
jgi:hypothetical protein